MIIGAGCPRYGRFVANDLAAIDARVV